MIAVFSPSYYIIIAFFLAIILGKNVIEWIDGKRMRRLQMQTVKINDMQSNQKITEIDNAQYKNMDVPELMKVLLAKLNCTYKEEDDGTISFIYQGEHFSMFTKPNYVWVRITDHRWYECSLGDIEEFSCMQKAINKANFSSLCTAIYFISKEENKMIVFSKGDFSISGEYHDVERYLNTWLSCFFRLKQNVVLEFEKEKQKIGIV